jgi:hypothetical protein
MNAITFTFHQLFESSSFILEILFIHFESYMQMAFKALNYYLMYIILYIN